MKICTSFSCLVFDCGCWQTRVVRCHSFPQLSEVEVRTGKSFARVLRLGLEMSWSERFGGKHTTEPTKRCHRLGNLCWLAWCTDGSSSPRAQRKRTLITRHIRHYVHAMYGVGAVYVARENEQERERILDAVRRTAMRVLFVNIYIYIGLCFYAMYI